MSSAGNPRESSCPLLVHAQALATLARKLHTRSCSLGGAQWLAVAEPKETKGTFKRKPYNPLVGQATMDVLIDANVT